MYLYRVFIIALALVGALTAVPHSQQRDQGAPPVQSGQQHPGAIIQFSTLPPWPSSGVVPERDAHRYVFLELATGDLVVSFPAGLGGRAPDTNSGQPITFRVRLAVATLGPKYPPEMPGGQVAADFIQEVYQFMTRKLLNSRSPFVPGSPFRVGHVSTRI